jgi:ABC-type tungstate transport system substrate-binding protein
VVGLFLYLLLSRSGPLDFNCLKFCKSVYYL